MWGSLAIITKIKYNSLPGPGPGLARPPVFEQDFLASTFVYISATTMEISLDTHLFYWFPLRPFVSYLFWLDCFKHGLLARVDDISSKPDILTFRKPGVEKFCLPKDRHFVYY